MNPLVPPAIEHLQANPGASIVNTAIDYGVSKSTLRRAWYKIRPNTVKVGRPESEQKKQALAFYLANPSVPTNSIAARFKISTRTLYRALKRNG